MKNKWGILTIIGLIWLGVKISGENEPKPLETIDRFAEPPGQTDKESIPWAPAHYN